MAKKEIAVQRQRAAAKQARKPPFADSKPAKKATRTISRDAKTGKLVDKATAKAKPGTTVNEKVSVKVNKRKLKLPKTVAQAADALYETKKERLAAQHEIEPLAQYEKDLKEFLINNLPKSDANGAIGKVAKAQIKTKEIPTVDDEKKFLAFARKPGNEDLLKIVPNMEAIQQRWENKKVVPGVKAFTVVTISSTKL